MELIEQLMETIKRHTGIDMRQVDGLITGVGQWMWEKADWSETPNGKISLSVTCDEDVDRLITVLDGRALNVGGDLAALEVTSAKLSAPLNDRRKCRQTQGNGRRRMNRGVASAAVAP